MPVASLKIGDVTLVGEGYAGKAWPETLGLEAPSVTWFFPVDDATKILAGPTEVTITLTPSDGSRPQVWQRIVVVGEAGHSPDALVRGVVFSDVRFYLPYGIVRASYNVTIPSGTGRQTQTDGVPVTTLPIVSNFLYVPTSLRGSDDGPVGVPWNAQQIALDVLQKACTGHDFKAIAFRDASRPRSSFVPNDVFVDVDGQTALGQVLGALGGIDVSVDDGTIVLKDAYLGAEKATVEKAVAKFLGSSPFASLERLGKLRWVSMSNVAPRAAKVLFTRRCELRIDSFEDTPANRYTTNNDNTLWGKTNDPIMVNVAKVTDRSLPVPSTVPSNIGGGTTAIMNTILPLDALVDAIAALADQPAGAPALSRQNMLAGPGGPLSSSGVLSGRLSLQYVVLDQPMQAGAGPNVNWIARLGSLIGSQRKLYLMNPVLARACRKGSIQAKRVGLLDAVTQERQPATVFMDFVQRPKNRGLAKNDAWGWLQNAIPPTSPNAQSYPTGIKSYQEAGSYNESPYLLPEGIAAPFDVNVLDTTRGLFFLTPSKQDTTKLQHEAENFEGLVWGVPVIGSKLNQATAIAFWEQAKQLLTHRVTIVVSAIPAGQDNTRALHAYDVQVEQALARLGATANAVVARAPVRELRVREGVTEARIPWDDDLRVSILGCFVGTGTGDPKLLTPVNDAQLRDFSISVFANYLAAVLDHYEGDMTLPYDPDVKPVGALKQVTTSLTPDGRLYTQLSCRGAAPVAPPENMMLQSTRNLLFGGLGGASD